MKKDKEYVKQCLVYASIASTDDDIVRLADELIEAIKVLHKLG